MYKVFLSSICLVAFIIPVLLQGQVLSVPQVIQEQDQWCWAATSCSILRYYGYPTLAQCTIAEYTRSVANWHNFGGVDCCSDPLEGCNYWNYNWGTPGSIQAILQHWGVSNYGYGSYLSISQVQGEISGKRPFVIRWGWTSGGGHFLVGYGIVGTSLYYMNPWFGEGFKISEYSWVVSGSNHTWTHTNILTTTPSPGFSVAPSSISYGSVCVGSSKQDSVTVTNNGNATLTISQVTSDSACFAVIPTRGSVGASSSQKFYVTFNPSSAGSQSGGIIFVHDAFGSPDTVTVNGTGTAPQFSASSTDLSFGSVLVGSSKQDSVTVTNTGTATLAISSVLSNNAEYTVTPTSGSIASSATQNFYITFTPLSSGVKNGGITFIHNARSSPDTVAVNGTGIGPQFSAFPTELSFGNVLVGHSKQDSVTVTNAGTLTLTILSVSPNIAEFAVIPTTDSLAPSASQKFYITFSPSSTGAESGGIIFVQNASESPDTVAVSGTGIAPRFSVSPTELSFGNVPVGSGKQDSVTVTNTGTATLAISSVSSNSDELVATPASDSLAPSACQKFHVTFSPVTTGSKNGAISFTDNASGSPHTVSFSGTAVSIIVAYQDKWNIVSVPFTVSDSGKASLFPNAVSEAFAYQGGYVSRSLLANGVGYWLKFSKVENIPFIGTPRTSDSINVVSRWNLIGSISNPVPASSITARGTSIRSSLYGYNRGYYQADTIAPGRGYWIEVTTSGELVLDTSLHAAKTVALGNPLKDLNQLIVEDAGGNSQTLYFSEPCDGLDISQGWELPPPPPAGIFDVRFGSGRMLEIMAGSQREEFPIVISSAKYPVVINWRLNALSLNGALGVGAKEIPMQKGGTAQISSSQCQIVLKIAAPSRFPKEFALGQNYPNPFNPATDVRYAIRDVSQVTLKVYDVLGREVATLVNEVKQPGEYSVTWDASKESSGLYFYRLTAGSFSQTRKLVLLR